MLNSFISEQVLPVMIKIGVIDYNRPMNYDMFRNTSPYATRMHAVCRYYPGPRGGSKGINDVKEIALHGNRRRLAGLCQF